MPRVTICLTLLLLCAAAHEDLQKGRGGPNMQLEFDMEKEGITPYPFKPFSKSYVQRALSDGVDWTTDPRGVVTAVKNQGPHGYCGTFGRIDNAEGQYALHSGQPARNLSVEQLVDCVGWSRNQMPSILGLPGAKTPGLMSWEDYPYNISKYPDTNPPVPGNPCKFDPAKVVPQYSSRITNMTGPAGSDEDQAAAFIHHNGPTSCGVNANVFAHHDGEWFVRPENCSKVSGGIDHSVSCVGFGVDRVKGPYWKIKNSWGSKWGDQGFIKLARGVHCGGVGTAHGQLPTYGDASKYYEQEEQVLV